MCGLLDQAVGLAGDDEAVLGEADVERLAAAAQGEEQPVGRGAGVRADRDRALEARRRCARNASVDVGAGVDRGARRAWGSPWRRW